MSMGFLTAPKAFRALGLAAKGRIFTVRFLALVAGSVALAIFAVAAVAHVLGDNSNAAGGTEASIVPTADNLCPDGEAIAQNLPRDCSTINKSLASPEAAGGVDATGPTIKERLGPEAAGGVDATRPTIKGSLGSLEAAGGVEATRPEEDVRWLAPAGDLQTNSPDRSLRGEFTVIDVEVVSSNPDGSGGCGGRGEHSDIKSTTDVVVRNGAGKVIGEANLGPGFASAVSCTFSWEVDNLPEEQSYVVVVGRHVSPTFFAEELEASGWRLFSTLG
jgi:hypothetical protein